MSVCLETSIPSCQNQTGWGLRTRNAERTALVAEALQRGGILRLRLRGESMLPTLWPGDEAQIANCSAADIRRGDVVLAFVEGRFVLHRVSSFSGDGYVTTRGDAMPRPDAALPAASIVGKVTQVTRAGRTVSVSSRCTSIRRALGILFCYSSLARRIALKFHSWRITRSQIVANRGLCRNLINLTSDPCNPNFR